MKRDLRIVFMGTPDFAVGILKYLVEHHYNIVGVVTTPDKPAGRGQKIHESAVKKYAQSAQLKVMQPKNLKSDDFLNDLKKLAVNLQIVVAFRMLPKVVWNLPKYGTFNLHASLLPQYRGAAPINWAIINGEQQTGVTTFFIEEKIDTGDLILQETIAIDPHETAGTLHDKLMEMGCKVTLKTVKLIETGKVSTLKQPEFAIKEAPKLFPSNCRINWNDKTSTIDNLVRGLNPYPGAWTVLHQNNQEITAKIFAVSKEITLHNFKPGTLFTAKNELKVAVLDGFLYITDLQVAGKKRMDLKSFLNGYQIESTAIFV